MVCDKLSQHIVRQAQETSGDAAQTSGDLREGSAGGGGGMRGLPVIMKCSLRLDLADSSWSVFLPKELPSQS